ncbi:hypothetical protein C2845_PM01G29370 [Panicum miliaceum]|uniref:KIB1-4 beta-propeller domain-containing protein n=1 Tax=Panicum miliaceum TaxID=4540 RepID=A0A3L6TPN6_PANMI|nr:hypothetical protein C2845_PM01G29370 [Panicum miliaceum]
MKVVCKDWYKATPKLFIADHPMWFSLRSDRMLFGSPTYEIMFSVKHNFQLPYIRYCSSAGNIITLVGKETDVWVLNAGTGYLEKLPAMLGDIDLIRQAVSWTVTLDYCATFALSGDTEEVTVSLHWMSTGWISRRYTCQHPFFPAINSAPVRRDNSIYCLDANCHIGIFDLDTGLWRVQAPSISWPLYTYQSCHLMSTDDGIAAIIVNKEHRHLPVMLRLDLEQKTWYQIRSLGGISVYTGEPTSLVIEKENHFMKNRAYFPSICGGYSLTEASVRLSNGQIIFSIEDECKASMRWTWFLVDTDNEIKGKPGLPSRKRTRDAVVGNQLLPYGTWIGFKEENKDDNAEIMSALRGQQLGQNR